MVIFLLFIGSLFAVAAFPLPAAGVMDLSSLPVLCDCGDAFSSSRQLGAHKRHCRTVRRAASLDLSMILPTAAVDAAEDELLDKSSTSASAAGSNIFGSESASVASGRSVAATADEDGVDEIEGPGDTALLDALGIIHLPCAPDPHFAEEEGLSADLCAEELEEELAADAPEHEAVKLLPCVYALHLQVPLFFKHSHPPSPAPRCSLCTLPPTRFSHSPAPLSSKDKMFAFLSGKGVSASMGLYGLTSRLGMSGNAHDELVKYLKANITDIHDAISMRALFQSEKARQLCAEGLKIEGVVLPIPLQFNLTGADGATNSYCGSLNDVMAQLKAHLLDPAFVSPPLQGPRFAHIFSGANGVDNLANSAAGQELDAYLQARWLATDAAGNRTDPVHLRAIARLPVALPADAALYLHTIPCALFCDGYAASEQLHVGFIQYRLKLGTVHPELAFLTSSYLLAGVSQSPVLGERVTDAQRQQFNDLHSEMLSKLGWVHFYEDQFVVLPHADVAHLGIGGKQGDYHVFKLALLGLMLDNGEVQKVAWTKNCLLCNALNTVQLQAPPPPLMQPPQCPRCSAVHLPGRDPKMFGMALDLYEISRLYGPGGPVESAIAPPISEVTKQQHKGHVREAQDTLSRLGYNANVTAPAFSAVRLPPSQLPYFAWGGGVKHMCGLPLMSFMFDLLHTSELVRVCALKPLVFALLPNPRI